MIRRLFFAHGFREPFPAEELRRGGFYFLRDHADGRLQSAFVFTWSNFRSAAEKGILPCRLWIRADMDAPRPDSIAIERANNAVGTYIAFRKGEWEDVCARFEQDIFLAFEASASGEEALQPEYLAAQEQNR